LAARFAGATKLDRVLSLHDFERAALAVLHSVVNSIISGLRTGVT